MGKTPRKHGETGLGWAMPGASVAEWDDPTVPPGQFAALSPRATKSTAPCNRRCCPGATPQPHARAFKHTPEPRPRPRIQDGSRAIVAMKAKTKAAAKAAKARTNAILALFPDAPPAEEKDAALAWRLLALRPACAAKTPSGGTLRILSLAPDQWDCKRLLPRKTGPAPATPPEPESEFDVA